MEPLEEDPARPPTIGLDLAKLEWRPTTWWEPPAGPPGIQPGNLPAGAAGTRAASHSDAEAGVETVPSSNPAESSVGRSGPCFREAMPGRPTPLHGSRYCPPPRTAPGADLPQGADLGVSISSSKTLPSCGGLQTSWRRDRAATPPPGQVSAPVLPSRWRSGSCFSSYGGSGSPLRRGAAGGSLRRTGEGVFTPTTGNFSRCA